MVEMRQSNKCGGVVTDEILTYLWDLVPAFESASPASCMATSQIYWFFLPTHLTKKKQRTKKWDSIPEKFYPIALVYVHRNQG